MSVIRGVQAQFLHQFLPRAYHFPIRDIISHRSFRFVLSTSDTVSPTDNLFINASSFTRKYFTTTYLPSISQVRCYRPSVYLNAKQEHSQNVMDNYKPRANPSVLHKFRNPLTETGHTWIRRIDLTCVQHVNTRARHSTVPSPRYRKSNEYHTFPLNHVRFIRSANYTFLAYKCRGLLRRRVLICS